MGGQLEDVVTQREFDGALEFIRSDMATIRQDQASIRNDVKTLLREQIRMDTIHTQELAHRKQRQFWIGISASLLSAIVAAVISTTIALHFRPAPTTPSPAAIVSPHLIV